MTGAQSSWPAGIEADLLLPPSAAAGIRDHGQSTYPYECCGALIGVAGEVRRIFPLPNTTGEGPRRRFLVGPADYRAAEREAAARPGESLLGFYHSHPDHPARPSAYDLDHAWPSFWYVIVSVREGHATDMTLWRLREDRSLFDEMALATGSEPLGG
jgi:proteasome lid subunit RPN8/RPN11